MTIKTAGSNNILSLGGTANATTSNSSISVEHGGTGDLRLSDYYPISEGGLTHSINTGVPSSGEIRFSDFLGTQGGVATKTGSGGTADDDWTDIDDQDSSGGTALAGVRLNITFEYDNNRIKYVFSQYNDATTNINVATVYDNLLGGLNQATATTKDARWITAVRYRWIFHDMDVTYFSNNGLGVKTAYVLGHDTAHNCRFSNNDYTTFLNAGPHSNLETSYRTLNFASGITTNKSFSTGIEVRANESRNNNNFSIATTTIQPRNNSIASGGYLQFQLQVYSEGNWQTATLWTANDDNDADGGKFKIHAQSQRSPNIGT